MSSSHEIKGALERYIFLVAQATIDLAEMMIAHKDFRRPQTMSETFNILCENKVIDAALAERLVKMVGMLNILSHAYEKIKIEYLFSALSSAEQDVKSFVTVVRANI